MQNHSILDSIQNTSTIPETSKSKAVDIKPLMIKWTMFSLLIFGLMAQHVLANEPANNLYANNYKAQSTYKLQSMAAKPNTKLYVSNHKDEDNISMLENGYDMMGSSGFSAGDVPPELALSHGKAIKADVVLVYSKYGSAKTASARMALIKEAAKTGKALTEEDVAEEKTNYNYYASYWAKIPTPLFGVHIIKLKAMSAMADKETLKEASKGLKILAVIKKSAADEAGLMNGDVLLSIAKQAVDKPEALSQLIGKFQGKTVAVKYARNGEVRTTQASIRQR